MGNTASAKDFVKYVVDQLVTQPEKVIVDEITDDLGVLVNLQVARDDMGKIIGKNGQTAKSLRVLLRVIGAKTNTRVNMKILEPAE